MKKAKSLINTACVSVLLAVCCIIFSSGESAAVTANYNYKWLQPYDLVNGYDIVSSQGSTTLDTGAVFSVSHKLADDWLCKTPLPVTDIHWWGSYWEITPQGLIPYANNIDPYRAINTSPQFMIEIYTDIPAGVGGPSYSRPGNLIWSKNTSFPGTFVGYEQNPAMEGAAKFGWDLLLDEIDWFYQGPEQNIFWISIYQTLRTGDRYLWGWETSSEHWNDLPVYWDEESQMWLLEDDNMQVDMAFGLTTVPVPGAVWLFGSGLVGLIGLRRKRRN